MDGRGDGGRDVRGMTGEQLKAAIFQQLFSGKLTKQLRSDGTAETLLKQIEKENPNHKKVSRIIKKEDGNYYEVMGNRETCITDELLFDIPDSWAWVHLNEIAVSGLGKTLNKSKDTGVTKKYLCSINVYWDGIHLDEVKEARFTPSDIDKYRLQKGDLLICEGGDAGRTAIWEYEDEMYYQNALHRVRFFGGINPHYFRSLLEFYKINGIIDSYCKGMTIKHLVQGSLNAMRFPLPPLAEQERIVAKIEELVPLVEQYTAKSEKLNALNASFPEMMKKSILQEAVKGRLVPQDPNDEPASVLLKKIAEEKKRLVREGKIKKQKPLPEITEEEVPFGVPEGWEWVRFSDIMNTISTGPFGSMLHKTDYESTGIPIVNPVHMRQGRIVPSSNSLVSEITAERLTPYKLHTRDIVFARRGDIGRSAVVHEAENGWICGTGSFFASPSAGINPEFVSLMFSTPYVRQALLGESVGTTMNNLNQKILLSFLFPLPPEKDQERIIQAVEKIDVIISDLKLTTLQ